MRKSFFLFLFLLCTHETWARVSVTAVLEDSEISIEDATTITVSVSGASDATEPVAPKVQGLKIVQTGESSQIQIINGKMSASNEYIYTVVPEEEGHFTIPPFSFSAGKTEYKSESLALTVSRGRGYTTTPKSADPFGSVQNRYQQKFSDEKTPKFWIETSVSNPAPYVSEQVLFVFRLYSLIGLNMKELRLPEFQNLWFEEIVPERKGTEVINGREYLTYEKIYALFPLKPGKTTIGETSLVVQDQESGRGRASSPFDSFFNDPFFSRGFGRTREEKLKALPLDIEVKPLPEPVPADFTALVGEFGLQVSLSADELQEGDTVTYQIVFSGVGNVRDARLPDLFFDGLKVYADKPVVEIQKSSKMLSGKKTFKAALVPTRSGDLVIPAFHLSFFDPRKAEYVSLPVGEKVVKVTPSTEEQIDIFLAGENTENDQKDVVYQDIGPLQADAALGIKAAPDVNPIIFYLFVFGLPAGFLIVVFTRVFVSLLAPTTQKKRAQRHAYKTLQNHLRDSHTRPDVVLESLRRYFSALFDTPAQSLTASEMKGLCLSKNISADAAGRLERAVARLETQQYSFDKQIETAETCRQLQEVVKEIQQRGG